jgi:cobalamin biosynthesis Mg chelatase CobN
VTTPAGTSTLASGFTVTLPSPTIASIDPKLGVQGETLTVTITGTYLEGATAVSFGTGITVDNSTVSSDNTQIAANITISSTATAGARNVSVTTPAGTGTLGSGFTVEEKETSGKSSNSSKIWIGIGVGAGVLVAAAVIIYLVTRKRASEDAIRRPSRRR